MSYLTNPSAWALGYLKGRARAFSRGNLTVANVLGAARKALALGASYHDIAAVLAIYGLAWDPALNVLSQVS